MTTTDRRDDIDAIKSLKYRYLRCVDLRLWDELAETLAPEVSASYGKRLSYTGRDEVVNGLRGQMADDVITEHQAHHPEIEVDGDTATGRWYLQDRVIVPAFDTMIIGSAFYEDTYARVDGKWVITSTGYKRTYEAMLNLKDIPSFQLTDNHLAPTGGQ
ncbi:nuclear transport factor 2 family protein [Dietzia cercidiphylli]|uniref:nuclear transport factor 2 family protein n=1 Tax=Dietzia cercidiphylli TaxID=498199 RepID=UPI00223B29F6|nr:nuclear transport factor 2 family protein [Dietzia cercidiphylli]MCT1516079.1 nuclear transport factor 2 family protein [Dietzia cercidiphylli]